MPARTFATANEQGCIFKPRRISTIFSRCRAYASWQLALPANRMCRERGLRARAFATANQQSCIFKLFRTSTISRVVALM
jgi:hypothetical protein